MGNPTHSNPQPNPTHRHDGLLELPPLCRSSATDLRLNRPEGIVRCCMELARSVDDLSNLNLVHKDIKVTAAWELGTAITTIPCRTYMLPPATAVRCS